jgi:hypothetical protein
MLNRDRVRRSASESEKPILLLAQTRYFAAPDRSPTRRTILRDPVQALDRNGPAWAPEQVRVWIYNHHRPSDGLPPRPRVVYYPPECK